MSLENVEPSEALAAFKAASLQATEAFNRHDFDTAFALLPPDIEWHPLDSIPGARCLRGREAVREWFQQVATDFPDFRTERLEFTEAAEGVFIVQFENRATGRMSGVSVTSNVMHQVWEIARDPWRVREFTSLSAALEGAGLQK